MEDAIKENYKENLRVLNKGPLILIFKFPIIPAKTWQNKATYKDIKFWYKIFCVQSPIEIPDWMNQRTIFILLYFHVTTYFQQ